MSMYRQFIIFQSTLPLRGATWNGVRSAGCWLFQSTLPLRGATRLPEGWTGKLKFQSTLPLRGATRDDRSRQCRLFISIHTPLAGSDFVTHYSSFLRCLFQSTLPLRGATIPAADETTNRIYFNPHSPCGERRSNLKGYLRTSEFQSTLPLRGATAEMRHF